MAAHAFGQGVAVEAVDRRFASGIDVGDDDRVGVVEADAELLKQVAQARVAVRLDHGDDPAFRDRPRRGQHAGEISVGW